MADEGEAAPGRGWAAASWALGAAALVVGGVGTGFALAIVPGSWSDTAQLGAFSAPAVGATALAGTGALAGLLAAWRAGLGRWPAWVGLLGVAGAGVVAVGALGWMAFLGGLSVLASFAWH